MKAFGAMSPDLPWFPEDSDEFREPFELYDKANGSEHPSDPPSDELQIEDREDARRQGYASASAGRPRKFSAVGRSFPPATDEAEAAADEPERRWPVAYAVLFIVISSVLLWALIIGGIRWLVA